MKAYDIWFRKSVVARKVYVWTRHADDEQAARESAQRALDEEYYGEPELLDLVEVPSN